MAEYGWPIRAPSPNVNCTGSLDIITGPMFSGKSTSLLRRLFEESIVGLKVLYINHSHDDRSTGPYSTHNPLYKQQLSETTNVEFVSSDSLSSISGTIILYDVIGIDEAQFFDDLYERVVNIVETHGKSVIVAGLNADFNRNKFGQILDLEPIADTYTKLTALCKLCADKKIRKNAPFTHRFVSDTSSVTDVGGSDKYMPLCRECYLSV